MTEDKQIITNYAYDCLAKSYKDFSYKKRTYINSINNLLIPYLKRKNVLDIGSGDGQRISKIYKEANIKKLTCFEPSLEMYKLLSKFEFINPENISAQKFIKKYSSKFDVATALWNVFGHISSLENLEKSLINIRKYLKKDGKLIIDVNNRLNASSYGLHVALYRIIIDYFNFKRVRGDVKNIWKVDGKEVIGYGHIFSPFEIKNIIKKNNFEIEKILYVNYENGTVSNNLFNGQMFIISKRK